MGLVKFLKRKIRRQRTSAGAVDEFEKDGTATATSADDDGGALQLSWKDIQRLTTDFATVIGYGGFSTVYLAHFRHSSSPAAAVKVYCTSQRLYQVFKQELHILLHLRHPNIVKLLGYCDDREEGALILEYVTNGNLHEKLHSSKTLLTWNQRTRIAFQLAETIAYLHESCSPHVVHADIKPSNILLDHNLNCKLCDFGSAKLGFSSAVIPPNASRKQRMMITGSPGYADPIYLRSGLVSKKNDVYSFGVVLLELVSGIEAFSPSTGERLVARAAPLLREAAEMVDPRLRGAVDLEEARTMAALAVKCVSESPGIRPSASEIMTTMRRAISSQPLMFEKKCVKYMHYE